MDRRGSSIALITCCIALCATAYLFNSTTSDRPPGATGDQREPVSDFDRLIALMDAEPKGLPTLDLTRPAAVSAAAEISEADKAEILNLVIADVLESPDFQHSRDFYGTPGVQSAVILTDGDVKLPRGFKPHVPGWNIECCTTNDEPDPDAPRVVAIRIDKFAPHKPAEFLDGHVSVCISNGGGNPDGTIHTGGRLAYYCLDKSDGAWTVECVFAMDP